MVVAIELTDIALQVFMFLIIARALISWVRLDPYHPIVQFLYRVTEPVLEPIRRVLPPTGLIDLSPMIAIIIIFALRTLLATLLV